MAVRRKNRQRETEMIEGKFVYGWAEFLKATSNEVRDEKGRLLAVDQKPPKIVTRLMVELEDGSCVPVHGEHFESLSTGSIPIPMSSIFPEKMKEIASIASKAYKKGEKVRVRKTTFKDNGWIEFDELE